MDILQHIWASIMVLPTHVIALLGAMVLLQAGDVISTNLALSVGGREDMPTVAFLMKILGPLWWVPKVAVSLVGAYLLAVGFWPALVAFDLFFVWLVFWNNLPVYRRRKNR